MRDVIMIAEICAHTDCKDCPFCSKDECTLQRIPQFWNTKKIGDIIDDTRRQREEAEKHETELKPIDVDVRGYTNRFECQMCLAEIYSEICLKQSDYEYCPYCGRKIKD